MLSSESYILFQSWVGRAQADQTQCAELCTEDVQVQRHTKQGRGCRRRHWPSSSPALGIPRCYRGAGCFKSLPCTHPNATSSHELRYNGGNIWPMADKVFSPFPLRWTIGLCSSDGFRGDSLQDQDQDQDQAISSSQQEKTSSYWLSLPHSPFPSCSLGLNPLIAS